MARSVDWAKRVALDRTVEAAARTGMADRSFGERLDHQRILVAIDQHLLNAKDIARGLALHPQPAATPRMKVREPGLDSLVERLAIHERDHQHFAARRMLDDRGEEAVTIEFGCEGATRFALGALTFGTGNGSVLSDCCVVRQTICRLVAR